MNHPLRLAIFTTLAVPILAGLANAQTPSPANPTPVNPPISSFGTDNPSLRRAMNLARQAAEQTNGGLEKYRAEARMHGPVTEAPVVFNADGSWTFRFRGSVPGVTELTIETVVTVAAAGTPVTVDYNGPIRNPGDFPPVVANPQVDDALALRRAMNLARQAAEKTNGGLEKYRAETAMYGSTERAPITVNPDGTWTFRFRGGPPGTDTPTVESIVTVSRTGQVTLVANNSLVSPPPPAGATPPVTPNSPAPSNPAPASPPEQPQPQGQQ